MKKPSEQALLAEYGAANAVYLTYDGYRWQSGSFLIAGVFVYWGFLISTTAPALVTVVSTLLVASLMSCWILFAHHYRQLYLLKLTRLQEIEQILNIQQHRRFMEPSLSSLGIHRAEGPKGHNIDIAVYLITSLGGLPISWVQSGLSPLGLVVVPLVAAVLTVVLLNERKAGKKLLAWRASI